LAEIDFNLPTPHDLVKELLAHESIRVIRTEIFGTDEKNFYAKIYFLKEEDTFSLNARPSDAISLSLTFSAPIYIDDSILINQPVKGHEDITNRRKDGKDWAEYLQSLSRDEFGKYVI
jgi:bifunctional DNase/RNase